MNKLQKWALIFSVFFGINYAIYILFHFDICYSFLHSKPWIEHTYAFFIGTCAFINLTLLQNNDK
ncbi:MAG: hypothetical protein DBY26_00285 [Amedibacillus dolichus]|uniref:Uncharacterized protein n=1 Tax=Amedibacillus dolichus TaxID=31971 RepID=A0A415PG33_9FIRM|nr:MAG: hypothetical protein DBY26_00285 [Amedibacillus dolichus]RHM11658.1 hypothetical protein DWZ83_05380 [Amedibacillus dolichus]